MHYFTVEQLGPKRSLKQHGELICQDVPIARTGLQIYGPDETPISAGAADVVRIERDPEEVFHPDTIASLQGAPIVNEHPTDEDGGRADVTPDNYRDLVIGHVMNPRRGIGADDDVLMADLLIWDQNAIRLIDAGKRELSVGYDAEYEELAPGHGRQKNIRANHLALVERGRCGPRCAIGDSELVGLSQCDLDHRTATEDGAMPRGKTTWAEKIRAAFKARDEAELEKAIDEGTEEETASGVHVHLHPGGSEPPAAGGGDNGEAVALDPAQLETAVSTIHALEEQMIGQAAEMDEVWDAIGRGADSVHDAFPHRDARRKKAGRDQEPPKKDDEEKETEDELAGAPGAGGGRAILPGFEMEAPPGTAAADMRRARDSALFEDSFTETVAMAEILVPGIRLPTFDRAAPPKKTLDAICAFRNRVLDAGYADPNTRELIDQITGGRFTKASAMTCDAARTLFRAAASMKGRANTPRAVDLIFGGGTPAASGEMRSPADLQAVLDKHYSEQRP